jgi:Tfp pilus assembly protein PilF
VAYIDKDDLNKAKAVLDRALKLKPDYASAYFHLGLLYDKLGDLEKARESYKRVIELDRYGELGRRANEMVGGFNPKVTFSLQQ